LEQTASGMDVSTPGEELLSAEKGRTGSANANEKDKHINLTIITTSEETTELSESRKKLT